MQPVLWIRDILVPGYGFFRIRVLLFRQWLTGRQQKISFFAYLLFFEGIFTSIFKDKKSKRIHRTVNQDFSYCFCSLMEGSGFV
jgi:hypothetical protein